MHLAISIEKKTMADINPWSNSKMASHSATDHPKSSKLPKLTVVARIVTLISLVVSLALIKTNHPTLLGVEIISYKKFATYKYMLGSTIVGIAYTLLMTPFAAYYAIKGKRLINHFNFLQFEFYGDKVILCILATGVGAAFGATMVLTSDFIKYDSLKTQYNDFFNMTYVSAGFLFIGFISSAVSSVLSSLTLSFGD